MQETRATWTDLIPAVGLKMAEVFDQGQEEYIPGVGNILTLTNGDGAQRNFTGKTGVGELEQYDDGDDLPGGRRYKTYTTKVAYNNYGKFIEVTKNTIEDRDFSAELDEMKDLSTAFNYSQDRSAMQIYNGGFTALGSGTKVNGYTITGYGDAKATFSTVHPTTVPGGSTQSNASSTGIKFGHDNLEVAKVALIEQQTDDGLPLAMLGKETLVVPPALKREATEEIMSELDPETANNAINVFKGSSNIVMSIHLAASNGGSDTAWFLTVVGKDKNFHELRQGARLETEVNIKNKVATFTVDGRWADYTKDWRRKWGSKGDLAAYSG